MGLRFQLWYTNSSQSFKPGVVTLDGHVDDWNKVDGFDFSLLVALNPHQDHAYKGGKMTAKVFDGTKFVRSLDQDLQKPYSDIIGSPQVVPRCIMKDRNDSSGMSNDGGECCGFLKDVESVVAKLMNN